MLLTKPWLITVRNSTSSCKLHVYSILINWTRQEMFFQMKALVFWKSSTLTGFCAAHSLTASDSFIYFFLLFLVLGVKHIHSPGPWLFAWHMHDWVSWFHTLFSHSLGSIHVCVFFMSSAFVSFMLTVFSVSCVYHLFCLCVACIVVSFSLGSSPTSYFPFLSHPSPPFPFVLPPFL